MSKRHYSTVGNIDLRMLKRQKAQLMKFLHQLNGPRMLQDKKVQTQITIYQADALHGMLHLVDAIEDNAQVSAMPRDGRARNA